VVPTEVCSKKKSARNLLNGMTLMTIRSCVNPKKRFIYGIHKPVYNVQNLRLHKELTTLGPLDSEGFYTNSANYPETNVQVDAADWIFEIPNPLSFRGSTFIDKEWADNSARNPDRIHLPCPLPLSFSTLLKEEQIDADLFDKLPDSLLLSLATTSTDPLDLRRLAEICCHIHKDQNGNPDGLQYKKNAQGQIRAVIHNHALFEAVANNPALPDSYKLVMVLRPGAQGGSEIVGEYEVKKESHVFEYLRRNSYIAGGHYAANMSDDAIRYSIDDLSETDMAGLRHLYYQRTFLRLAAQLDIAIDQNKKHYSEKSLEALREAIVSKLQKGIVPPETATLWGWNFGFDYAPTHYRLHASHQQIHQQYAMLPERVTTFSGDPESEIGDMASFGCGDMVAEIMRTYEAEYNSSFFSDYLACIRNNERMDANKEKDSSLIVWEDKHAILFVPKAQMSQWELQLMTLIDRNGNATGNILEADTASRISLNKGIYRAQKALAGLGAKMVTSIEYPKRIGSSGEKGQHLLYSFLPRLPESPGAFSEAQLRYINGHYPEDFAAVCRQQLRTAGL